jgi:hypothetical protein
MIDLNFRGEGKGEGSKFLEGEGEGFKFSKGRGGGWERRG